MAFWNRRKPLDSVTARHAHSALKPTLSWPHLIGLGVGGIVGTGIYTLTGVAAGLAGPSVMLSFVVAGIVCACAALAYAEMSTMMPIAGSAYTYTYASLGELLARCEMGEQVALKVLGWGEIHGRLRDFDGSALTLASGRTIAIEDVHDVISTPRPVRSV